MKQCYNAQLYDRQVKAMLSAPIAAAQLLDPRTGLPKSGIVEEVAGEEGGKSPINLKDLQEKFTAFRDRVYYGDVLPPVGSQQLSFARLMELLAAKKVKRITLMADGQVALVEVCPHAVRYDLRQASGHGSSGNQDDVM